MSMQWLVVVVVGGVAAGLLVCLLLPPCRGHTLAVTTSGPECRRVATARAHRSAMFTCLPLAGPETKPRAKGTGAPTFPPSTQSFCKFSAIGTSLYASFASESWREMFNKLISFTCLSGWDNIIDIIHRVLSPSGEK